MRQVAAAGYTADLPGRFALIKILFGVNVLLSLGLLAYGFTSKTSAYIAIAIIYTAAMVLVFLLGMLQQRAYRQPAIRVLPDGLVYYGAVIPWSAIRQAGVLRIANGAEQAFVRVARDIRFGTLSGEPPNKRDVCNSSLLDASGRKSDSSADRQGMHRTRAGR